MVGAVEIDGSRLTIISGEDAEAGAIFGREGVANGGDGVDEFLPTQLFAEISVDFVGGGPPRGVDGCDGQEKNRGKENVSDEAKP